MAFGEPPVTIVLLPVVGCPAIPGAFSDPASLGPDMFMSVPVPVARSPDKPGARRRILDHARRRRREVHSHAVVNGAWARCPYGGHAAAERNDDHGAEQRLLQRARG